MEGATNIKQKIKGKRAANLFIKQLFIVLNVSYWMPRNINNTYNWGWGEGREGGGGGEDN